MKKLIQTLFFFLLVTQICFAQWFWQSTPIDHDLFSVKFISPEVGWIVGESGTILKTTNGGETWISQSSGTSDNLNSVSFTNINTGVAVGNNGTILRTTNGGENWVSQFSGTYYDLNGVSFTNVNIGTVVGSYNPNTYTSIGIIIRTTNGGETWETQSSGIKYHLSMVFFTDINNGSVVGYSGSPLEGIILRTTNGGETWASQCKTENTLYGIYFSDAKTGMVVGTGGRGDGPLILKTNDGGETWINKNCGMTGVILNSVHLTDTNNGTAVGLKYFPSNEAVILRTTNGGETWISQTSELSNYLNDVFFIDINNGIVVCSGGIMLRTTNGGVTFVEEEKTTEVPTKFLLSQNYPNPFNPVTTIKYQIPHRSNVSLKVYDILGNKIADLVNEEKSSGVYEANWNAANLSSGVYFYQLKAGDFITTKKMILMK